MKTGTDVLSSPSAAATTATVQTTDVRMSTGRIPQTPIQRLVSGPATAWPMLVAASTRPAAPYDSWIRSTCIRNASESMPPGKRATSWAAMIRPTPRVLRRLPYVLTRVRSYRPGGLLPQPRAPPDSDVGGAP
ncbi:hypothetical protein MAFF212519_22120 [Clavibacter michiganensis]